MDSAETLCTTDREPWGVAKLRLTIPSTVTNVIATVEAVKRVTALVVHDEDWLHKVEFALHEGLLNGHFHGNKADPAKLLRIECTLSEKHVDLLVEDDGEGFDSAAAPDDAPMVGTRGRGLFLIRQFMDEVNFNECGNQIYMRLTKE